MKKPTTLFILLLCSFVAITQTAVTAVNISSSSAGSDYSYFTSPNTYNWAVNPNNSTVSVNGFTAGGLNYSYASFLAGTVKLRRVNNASITGNYTLVWAEYINGTNTFNMLPAYQNDMEAFFNNRTYNKGTDNFFDNTSSNNNNIERLDWVLSSRYSTPVPDKIGFAIFERGAIGAHDAFCIAAITAVDGSGNPTAYGSIVRVTALNYGDPGPSVTYRILKAPYPSDLLDAGTSSQNRGGVIISLQNLGIAANQAIYGYSLMANDLPLIATPADLVDYTNSTNFPTNTGSLGGIDMVAVTGIYIENSVLPVDFTNFSAVENGGVVTLKWSVANERNVQRYEAERSTDGRNFYTVCQLSGYNTAVAAQYACNDHINNIQGDVFYYRIKEIADNGAVSYSKTIIVKRAMEKFSVLVYPNPATSGLAVSLKKEYAEPVNISVYNAVGIEVLMQKNFLSAGNNSFSINSIERLPRGVYSLVIRGDKEQPVRLPFVKQ